MGSVKQKAMKWNLKKTTRQKLFCIAECLFVFCLFVWFVDWFEKKYVVKNPLLLEKPLLKST